MRGRPGVAAAAIVAFIATFLAVDTWSDRRTQLLIGAVTWAALAFCLKHVGPALRAQTLLVVAVATCAEVVGSIVWGVYEYRLGNLPLFVPPAHGLVYLTGLRLSQTALVERRTRAFVACVLAFALGWTAAGLTVLPREDVAGAIGAATFVVCVLAGRARATYAGVFVAVAALEFYGTALGTWRWAEVVPGLGLPDGNPPSGVASGYVLFDVIAITLAPRVVALARRTDRWCGEVRLALRSAA
jgi:hypothetical protein